MKRGVKFASDLAGIARFRAGGGSADAGSIVSNRGSELAYPRLHPLPGFQRTSRGPAPAGFEHHRGTSPTGNQHPQRMTSGINHSESQASQVQRQDDRDTTQNRGERHQDFFHSRFEPLSSVTVSGERHRGPADPRERN